jgi:hypothetical protein
MLARIKEWLKPTKRRRRLVVGLLVALLAYPVLGTLALWTGFVEWVARSEDLRLEIENPSYTIWPGRIHLKNVRIYMNGDTQFILTGQDLFTSISVLDLMRHRIHVTRLAAHDVHYQMRVQVKDPKGIERRLAAYPKLEGLPGTNTVNENVGAATEPREESWTVVVDGIDVSVVELWFFEYRYLGKGTLRGGFTVGPHIMGVRTAVQDLGPGELRFGEKQPIARELRGQVTCAIPELDPSAHADESFLEFVSARLNLKADILTLANVGAYMPAGIQVMKGAGPLAFDLYMEKGYLGSKSHLDFETDAIGVSGDGFGVATDWKLHFDAAGEKGGFPFGRADFKSAYVAFGRGKRELTIQSRHQSVEAALDTIRLGRATDLKRAALRLPDITTSDLADFDVLLPKDSPISVRGGEAKASLRLDMDKDYWARGPLKAELLRSKVEGAGVIVGANTWLDADLALNPKRKIANISELMLRVRNGSMHVKGDAVEDWWMNLSAQRLSYRASEPPTAEGAVSVRTKNLQPALEALAKKDVISDIIPILTRLDDFRAKTSFRKTGDTTDVTIESESDVWDVAGRVHTSPKISLFAVVVGGQAVSLGVADLGQGLTLKPFAKTDWLNEQLARFPQPLIQMVAAKP